MVVLCRKSFVLLKMSFTLQKDFYHTGIAMIHYAAVVDPRAEPSLQNNLTLQDRSALREFLTQDRDTGSFGKKMHPLQVSFTSADTHMHLLHCVIFPYLADQALRCSIRGICRLIEEEYTVTDI